MRLSFPSFAFLSIYCTLTQFLPLRRTLSANIPLSLLLLFFSLFFLFLRFLTRFFIFPENSFEFLFPFFKYLVDKNQPGRCSLPGRFPFTYSHSVLAAAATVAATTRAVLRSRVIIAQIHRREQGQREEFVAHIIRKFFAGRNIAEAV